MMLFYYNYLIDSTDNVESTVSASVLPSSSESLPLLVSFKALNFARDFIVSLLSLPKTSLGIPVLGCSWIFFGFCKHVNNIIN